MRLVFLFILALNILYFLYPKEDQEPSRDFQRGKQHTPMLVTLGEQQAPPLTGSRVPAEFSGQVAVPVAAAPVFARESAESESSAEVSVSEAPKGVSEIAQQLEMNSPKSDSKAPQKKPESKTNLSCYSLGPFNKQTAADTISKQLKNLGGKQVSVRTKTEQRNRGYWVYLPSYPSREAAITAAEKLAASGFTDYFVVSGGEHNNSISLGLFTLKQGSKRRADRLSQMGFKPKVEARNEEKVVFWVDYRASKKLEWEKNNQSKFEFIGLDHLVEPCP